MALVVWLIFKEPLKKSFSWLGDGPPDYENLPKGLNREAVESHRLLQKYGHDPRTPHGQSGTRSILRTKQTKSFTVPRGGAWLITPKEMREEGDEEEEEERIIKTHDLGTSFVLEAQATRKDIEGVKFIVTIDTVALIIPVGNLWLYGIRSATDDSGNRLFRMFLHDDINPKRSWVDLWDGVLRVNMPIDTEYTSAEVVEKQLRPVVRSDPPPDLPEIPDYKKNKPSIYGLRVKEFDQTFEVIIMTEHQVRDSFKYELEHNIINIYFEEAKKKPMPRGLLIRAKLHELHITLPATVLKDSANHMLEDDTFHIYLHKG